METGWVDTRIQIINILEQIHTAGYIFNDLKLDNFMMDFGFGEKQAVSDAEENIF